MVKQVKVQDDVHKRLKKLKNIFELKNPSESYTLSDVIKIVLMNVEVELEPGETEKMEKLLKELGFKNEV